MSISESSGQGRIVVGVDGSSQSKQALRWASGLAAATHAELEAVAAWDYPSTYGWAGWPDNWNPGEDTGTMLTVTVDEVFGAERPANLKLVTVQGGAAQVLLEQAKGATLIVVGSRGHGGFTGMMLGSVSAVVAEHAGCPVLVVHGDQPLPEGLGATGL